MPLRLLPLLFAGLLPLAAAAGHNERLLNNEGLVVLAQAGYNEKFLIELVQSQPARFDTSVEGLVYLAKQGISEKLVRLILASQRAAAAEVETEEPHAPAAKPAPVRMKVVKQKMLVAAQPGRVAPDAVIMVEKRAFGDRYFAVPPVTGTQVAAFH